MKNLFTLSFVILFCMNGFVYSQGQPFSLEVNERTLIKDTLGNVIKLSDCQERLNAGGWILHPEKNEGGKVIYVLFMKSSKTENDLLSDTTALVTEEDLQKVKKGKFHLQSRGYDVMDIHRKKNKQIEYRTDENGVKIKDKFRIVWGDDASYVLCSMRSNLPSSNELRYKVVEVGEDFYIARVVGSNYLGEIIKVSFK